MSVRTNVVYRCFLIFLIGAFFGLGAVGWTQTAKPVQLYPDRLPYSFGNFVWWSDDQLRVLLKKRIPGLGDEIPTTGASIGRMRDALKALLKENGIAAEIYSEEPSYFGPFQDSDVPAPSIEFSILDPKILLSKVTVKADSDRLVSVLQSEVLWGEGKPYSAFHDWMIRSRIKAILEGSGNLDGQIQIARLPPFREGDHFQVGLAVNVIAGPKYHISSIAADGGPLLADKDLSRFFGMSVGDVAGRFPLEKLEGMLRSFYLHNGYADVEIENRPVLDHEDALVSYHLSVIPGPVYHLRNLQVEKLNGEQENKARELLGMKPGDIYSDEPLTDLYRKIANDPLFKGYHFSYKWKRDKTANVIDLSLEFLKESNESNITIK